MAILRTQAEIEAEKQMRRQMDRGERPATMVSLGGGEYLRCELDPAAPEGTFRFGEERDGSLDVAAVWGTP